MANSVSFVKTDVLSLPLMGISDEESMMEVASSCWFISLRKLFLSDKIIIAEDLRTYYTHEMEREDFARIILLLSSRLCELEIETRFICMELDESWLIATANQRENSRTPRMCSISFKFSSSL